MVDYIDAFHTDALKKVSDSVNIPIAAGERVYTAKGFHKIIATQAVDIVQPDISNTGGILKTKKIAALAEAANMRVALHNCASTLSTAVTLQLSSCLANAINLEVYPSFKDSTKYVQVLKDSPEDRIRNGKVEVGSGAGLGVELAKDRLKDHLFAACG